MNNNGSARAVEATRAAKIDSHAFAAEDAGYKKTLKPRQIQMIAIGGAIGSGLFMGAGARLAEAGPSLAFVYAVCGIFAWFIIRAMGELVMHRPSTGSFVSYAREFYNEKWAFTVGWMYWTDWVMVAIADLTAAALYLSFFKAYFPFMADIPQWTLALGCLGFITALNLVSVKIFGELEFWFAFVKVAALVTFLCVGIYMVLFGTPLPGHEVGFKLISDNGGWFPFGLMPAIIMIQGVIFAYGSIELVGTAAGEAENVKEVMPKAIRAVMFRIAIFYVGSVLLLAMLLPHSAYQAGVSPFVTFFGSIGFKGADAIMNMVLVTAALSSLNAGIYSTGRILRSLAIKGSAPSYLARMNKQGVPFAGIMLTTVASLLGVGMNAIVPGQAFEIAMTLTAVLIIGSWSGIVLCQLKLYKLSKLGLVKRPDFRMPLAPYSGYATLGFFGLVLALIACNYPVGTFTIAATPFYALALVAGWFLVRRRVRSIEEGALVFNEHQELISVGSEVRLADANLQN
ncbi:amino acid permease [Pantoea sp. Ap-967]|uniref:amino acid permease n=1 Tax=Pantoea sp. Ap-967 TaxID=2608362 RepID=UPI00141F104D|nr:amino acid permease [Pantoea sp. Ap-967]NIE77161.1 amino acid permease [Pantoea sp. Ap-967]